MICMILLHTSISSASDSIAGKSTITLPIEVDLQVLEAYLDTIIPDKLADIHKQNKVCIKPQYLKTKSIPKCRRDKFKISCKEEWIKLRTIPKIKCDIQGWVKKDGKVLITGKGKKLRIALPVKAQVSVKANFTQTADAKATLYIDITPHIHKDWSISAEVTPEIIWQKKPTIKLLNMVKITLLSKVEPKLEKSINKFIRKLPHLLKKLKVKDKIAKVWKEIQEPIKLDDDSNMYLLFKPKSISYSGLNIVNNTLHTTISTVGNTNIYLGKPNVEDCKKSQLCNVGAISSKKGAFSFHLPVTIKYSELLALSNKNFIEGYTIDLTKSTLPALLKISNPKIEKSSKGNLKIMAHILYDNRSTWLKAIDIFDWFDVSGEMTFEGRPTIDKHARSLVLDNLVYSSTTNNKLFDLMVDASSLDLLSEHLRKLTNFKFGKRLDKAIIKANKSLKNVSVNNVKITTSLQIASIDDIKINEKDITITTKLSGIVNAKIEL